MFWTVIGVLVVALLGLAWAWDRRRSGNHTLKQIDDLASPRHGGADAMTETYGMGTTVGRQGGMPGQNGPAM